MATCLPPTLRQLFVAAYLAGMALLTLGVLWLLQDRLSTYLHAELLGNGRMLAERLVGESRLALSQGSSENIRPLLETVCTYPNVLGVLVASADGKAIASGGDRPEAPDADVLARLSDGTRHIEWSDRMVVLAPVFSVSKPVSDPYGNYGPEIYGGSPQGARTLKGMGYVALTLSKTQLETDLRKINEYTLTVMVTGILSFTVLLMWLLRQLTQPIKALARTMADPETVGRFDPVAVRGVREARTIAVAFNALIGKIAQFSRELADSKAEIQRQNVLLTQTVNEQIDELRRQNARLEEASRVKSQFIANMSHEVRTPIHNIVGALAILDARDQTPFSDEQKSQVLAIHSNVDRLLGEINGILDFSQLGSHSLRLKERSNNLESLSEHTVRQFNNRAEAKQLALSLTFAPGLPEWVCVDGPQFTKVLGILIDNAIKFTDHGTVQVSVGGQSTSGTFHTRLMVQDTGIGIPTE